MTRAIRILLVVVVAAVGVSAMASAADARAKKPGAAETQKKKGCKLPGKLGTLEHGGELLEEDVSGDGYNVYTCSNGTLCMESVSDSGFTLKVCWYSPARLLAGAAGSAALAPGAALAKAR